MTRIAIIGAGAIGSTLGALLSSIGQPITLIGRSEHVKIIQREGLHIEGALGEFTSQVAVAETLDFQPDIVFLTVKTQDVLATAQANQRFLVNGLVVTFQNGVRSDELVATLVPHSHIISSVVNISASYLMPGSVRVLYPGSLVVGRPFTAALSSLHSVAAILRRTVQTQISLDIRAAHWLKLIINLNNALPALTNMGLAHVYADPYLCQLGVLLMREGLMVTQRAGIRLESLPGVPAQLIRLMERLPVTLAGRMLLFSARRLERHGHIFGSTHQSILRRRVTEIDYLNGEIVRLSEELNVPTLFNKGIVELVHQVEQSGKFLTVDAIRSALNPKMHCMHAG